jgi:prepilin-type N-terminal cleavage/methylation domain-containing protein
MRNKNAAVSATNSFRTPHSALRTPLAFTLIELLVVISIMAILAGFTLMVLGGIKKRQYLNTATAQLHQIETALDNYKAKYGVYPPGNANNPLLSQLYYELSGTAINGVNFVTLDGSSQIKIVDVQTAYGVGGFINCSKGSGEEAQVAKNFLPSLPPNRFNLYVTNNGIQTAMLVTSVGGPDQNYQPLNAAGLNPFRYAYPGTNNPSTYDLWIDLSISGKTNRIGNWGSGRQIL